MSDIPASPDLNLILIEALAEGHLPIELTFREGHWRITFYQTNHGGYPIVYGVGATPIEAYLHGLTLSREARQSHYEITSARIRAAPAYIPLASRPKPKISLSDLFDFQELHK